MTFIILFGKSNGSRMGECKAEKNSAESVLGDSLDQIYAWIDQITFSRPKKNIARDFSDGVLMAELIKRYYPRHIDVHNYIPGNSIGKKVDNWCTLNRKVLSKLDLKLGKDVINQLANSQPGVIEKVLTDLRTKISKDCNADKDSLYGDYDSSPKNESVPSILSPEEAMNKTVPRHVFVKLKQELEQKKDVIDMLHQKVSHLENLMKLKDQRIADLTAQVTKPPEKNTTPRSNTISSGVTKHRTAKI